MEFKHVRVWLNKASLNSASSSAKLTRKVRGKLLAANASASVGTSGNSDHGSEMQKDGDIICLIEGGTRKQAQMYHLSESQVTNALQLLQSFFTPWCLSSNKD